MLERRIRPVDFLEAGFYRLLLLPVGRHELEFTNDALEAVSVAIDADTVDLDPNFLARNHLADSLRRTGQDHIARQQRGV
jgi:hypothetical protein